MTRVSRRMRNLANRDRALKISLEKPLNSDLKTVFGKFMRSFRSQFKKTGIQLNAHVITPALEIILTRAYKRTAAAFTAHFQVFRKQQEPDPEEQQAQDAILAFIALVVPLQVARIINTVNDELSKKIKKIASDAINTGETIDPTQLADLVTQEYNQILASRIPLIGMFATQNGAEATKRQLALPKTPQGKKVWVAILDSRTRTSHAFADGQERFINDPFTVMGQSLNHPGDISLGATPDNVINCRCSAIYL